MRKLECVEVDLPGTRRRVARVRLYVTRNLLAGGEV